MVLLLSNENQWQPISTAPFSRDVELAISNGGDAYVLVFACRRMIGGWLNVAKGKRIDIQPTHWRQWTGITSMKRVALLVRSRPEAAGKEAGNAKQSFVS